MRAVGKCTLAKGHKWREGRAEACRWLLWQKPGRSPVVSSVTHSSEASSSVLSVASAPVDAEPPKTHIMPPHTLALCPLRATIGLLASARGGSGTRPMRRREARERGSARGLWG